MTHLSIGLQNSSEDLHNLISLHHRHAQELIVKLVGEIRIIIFAEQGDVQERQLRI